jgi:putative transposase
MNELSEKTEITIEKLVPHVGIAKGKFYQWKQRYGKANEHNGKIPRDHWTEDWERQAVINFYYENPLDGYRRLTFMMLDQNIVAVSPTTVWRILSAAGLMDHWNRKPSKKGTGFVQPLLAHEHWHIDIAYINICGTFYYLCAILDGFSRAVVHFEIREQMLESDIEIIIQRAREKYPNFKPRIISDNGPQFISKDFKEFIRICGMTHVRTSPYYPQSNGKIEAWNKTVKNTTIRPKSPQSLDEARRMVEEFVHHYNHVRLHSAIGYIAPMDKLAGREKEIWDSRDQKLEAAREQRRQRRQQEMQARKSA